ncbi:MAG: hypothetical protein ACR2G0_01695 [Chthoniobacterales bacterium]
MRQSLWNACFKTWSRHDARDRRSERLLSVSCHFQTGRDGDGFSFPGNNPERRPNFSGLAREALRADASRSFIVETIVFGFVTLVSFWPIGIMIREVYRLLR